MKTFNGPKEYAKWAVGVWTDQRFVDIDTDLDFDIVLMLTCLCEFKLDIGSDKQHPTRNRFTTVSVVHCYEAVIKSHHKGKGPDTNYDRAHDSQTSYFISPDISPGYFK